MTMNCPDCPSFDNGHWTRRNFVRTLGAAAAVTAVPALTRGADAPSKSSESLVTQLYGSLTDAQKEEICFDWDYRDDRGLLRMHVNNNWQIVDPDLNVVSDFFTKDQQEMIEAVFWGLYQQDWHDRIRKQLRDDAGGYGKRQTIALFGTPGSDKFEFVMTGRHLTIRCDGNSTENVALGGPIFYGHAAQGFNEKPNHPGNVFWYQAEQANSVYDMLDGKQREKALVPTAPSENTIKFRGKSGGFQGIAISELTSDQREAMSKVLKALVEPYRDGDREEIQACLDAQGGLDKCHLAFYESGNLGNDEVWDVWRLEGPSFVWHYRGSPHVHVWANVASDPSVEVYPG